MLNVLLLADAQLPTVGGLPLHPLVVHAVVVLLPLAILGLFAIVLMKRLREALAGIVAAGLVIGALAALVAAKAGEQLALVTGISAEHRQLGDLLAGVAVALAIAGCGWILLDRGGKFLPAGLNEQPLVRRAIPALAGIALALGAAVLALTVIVGHSGASAVWPGKLAVAQPTAAPTASTTAYTAQDVAKHASAADCWTIVDGKVYDVSHWIARHPGGPDVIVGMCGIDAGAAFHGQHGNSSGPASNLQRYWIGNVG